jgi:hypothetical protein
MARVNHGNLLQHGVECDVATRLAQGRVGLRLVATHAMGPFEGARSGDLHEGNRVLRELLARIAREGPEAAEASPFPVLRAYARTRAGPARYPDSAELLAALLGADRLAGVLCEVDAETVAALVARWQGSALGVEARSWREALRAGALAPPADLDRPWLLTLDPYTWKHAGECRREERGPYLLPADMEALRACLAAHLRSGQPGAFLAFVYGLDASHAAGFRRAVLALADRLGLARALVGVAAPGARRHLGAVLASEPDLPAEAAEAWTRLRAELGLD